MEISNPKILVLSSCSPTMGPAIIGEQIYDALKQKGCDVDFLTKYPEPGHPEYLWVIKNNWFNKIKYRIINKLRWLLQGGGPLQDGHYLFYTYEKWPPVPSRLIINKIRKKYDLVYIVFWQELLSFEAVDKIYEKLHCQIHFRAVDYSPMSGGCHFTGDCDRYRVGCGFCPAIQSQRKDDFTAKNVVYRKKVYEKVNPVITGNLYMHEYYRKSFLLKNVSKVLINGPIINTDIFHPIDSESLQKKYEIPEDKKYIIFFGCQNLNDKRKGIKYLLEAFTYLYQKMGEDAEHVLIITAGRNYKAIKDSIPFDCWDYGFVSMNDLPELYSMATLFVCPSVNDAGPMMVNQSLCCGTPVVGFDMGAVKQVVKDKGTGICVPLRDSEALAEGMLKVIRMSSDEYKMMSIRAREVALATSSYDAQADFILRTYEKFRVRK